MLEHMSRRVFTCATLLTCGVAGLSTRALAADVWPSQPLKILVGFAAGGGNDIVARILAKELQQSLGQSVVVENKGGAGGLLANDIV
ncbi:MAG: tripartite tricarboxylate transporter substrate-binding protein, partial [Comamonas sp.]